MNLRETKHFLDLTQQNEELKILCACYNQAEYFLKILVFNYLGGFRYGPQLISQMLRKYFE